MRLQTVYLPITGVMALLLTGSLLLEASAQELNDEFVAESFGVTHQLETFTFMNDEVVTVNDLHIEVSVDDVKTKGKGPFGRAQTNKKKIDLKKGNVRSGDTAKITLEKDGRFLIKQWWWTIDGTREGDINTGSPD